MVSEIQPQREGGEVKYQCDECGDFFDDRDEATSHEESCFSPNTSGLM